MSIRPTEKPESSYSTEEAPPTDRDLKTKEAKKIYYMLLLFAGIDYIISVLIIINESNFFDSDEENDYLSLIIKLSCFTAFMLFFLLSLFFFNLELTKVIKIVYIVIIIIYYCYEFYSIITLFFDEHFKSDWIDILFFIFVLLTVIPRILFFCYIDTLLKKLIEIDDIKKGEEHDKFRQNLENKMERDDTNWSKTSLSSERKQQSQFISGNINNNYNKLPSGENIASIKENYIEEEKDNHNNDEN